MKKIDIIKALIAIICTMCMTVLAAYTDSIYGVLAIVFTNAGVLILMAEGLDKLADRKK